MADAGIELIGFIELEELCRDTGFLALPAKKFFNRAVIPIQNHQREGAPVDRGQLRQAIGHQIDSDAVPQWGEAGIMSAPEKSPLWWKAIVMEYGSGLFGEGRNASKQRYFPKVTPDLETWAKRHGFSSGRAVAAAIFRHGGIEPRRYLREGFKAAIPEIRDAFMRMGEDILAEWRRRNR
jgi:hypothetical protein